MVEIGEKKEKKKVLSKTTLFLGFLGLLVVFVIAGGYFLFPQIELKGKSTVILNYRQKYVEEGYKAVFLNKDISKEVEVSGIVNSDELGEYEIVYVIPGLIDRSVKRIVEVRDISKPVIEVSKEDIYLCPGSKFQGTDVKASDNYDGDLSKDVKVTEEKDKVIYSVSDAAGNKSHVIRKLIYEDKVAPEIELIGSKQVYAFVGENYSDLGYKVSDNCYSEIEKNVQVISNVDTSKAGKYEVTYKAVDEAGNSSSVTRTVVVSQRGRNGTIYLTFDDGPRNGTTDVILDILKEEGVEATFFITNNGPDSLIKRMHDEGHTIALHTASHNYAVVYASVDNYFNDLGIVNGRVKRITGNYSYIIRFPGGSSNTISRRYSQGIMSVLTSEVVNRGYKYYDWNISSGDAAEGSPSAANIRDNVIYSLRKDRVNMVLMHDIKTYTRDALRDIIRYGKDNGYTFEKITMETEMIRQRVNN